MRIAAPLVPLALVALLAPGGCATAPEPAWDKPGADLEDLEATRTRCMAHAVGAGAGEEGPAARAAIESAYRACMEQAGWQRRERP